MTSRVSEPSDAQRAALIGVGLAPPRMRVELTQALVESEALEEVLARVPGDLTRKGEAALKRSEELNLQLISYFSPRTRRS